VLPSAGAEVDHPITSAVTTSDTDPADLVGAKTSYQWEVLTGDDQTNPADWSNITGATSATFTPDGTLEGSTIRLAATVTDNEGHAATGYGNAMQVATNVDPTIVPGTSDVVGDLTFAVPTQDPITTAATPEGANYLGTFTVDPVTPNNGEATLNFEFDIGNDQINLAQGQTLTQSYSVTANQGGNTLASQTISISIGGPGNDNFVFAPGVGADTITNFNPQADTIELEHFANVQNQQQLAAAITTDAHGEAVIELGHSDSITIPGVTATYLQQHLQSMVHLH
jgi:hypothetical protein